MKVQYKFTFVLPLVFICAIVLIGASCKKKALTQETALKQIQLLPEIQEYTTQLRKRDSRPFIRQEPSNNQSTSIEFSVGESHPTHTILWNRFSIDKTNGEVFIFDVESGDYFTLNEWRKKK